MAQVFVAVVLALLAMPMVHADVCILSSSGDMVEDYLRTFAQIRQSGERVIIDGPCLSACTLVLSTISKEAHLRDIEGGARLSRCPMG